MHTSLCWIVFKKFCRSITIKFALSCCIIRKIWVLTCRNTFLTLRISIKVQELWTSMNTESSLIISKIISRTVCSIYTNFESFITICWIWTPENACSSKIISKHLNRTLRAFLNTFFCERISPANWTILIASLICIIAEISLIYVTMINTCSS